VIVNVNSGSASCIANVKSAATSVIGRLSIVNPYVWLPVNCVLLLGTLIVSVYEPAFTGGLGEPGPPPAGA
jgi:hypothetical protein